MQNDEAKATRLREAESAFRTAADAQPYVAACDKLRTLTTEYSQADAALKTVRREAKEALTPIHLGNLETAGRAARGIAGIVDLGKAVLGRGKKQEKQETDADDKVEAAAAIEARLRNKLSMATDDFSTRNAAVLKAARAFVEARAETQGAIIDGDALDEAALSEVLRLPALQGLEEYLVPS